MALISPGVQVTVIDESQYTPTAAGTIPYILLATEQDKQNPSGSTAVGTTQANAGKLITVSSQRDLTNLFGTPTFKVDSSDNPIHGHELNEYGLLAAYSALGVSNRVYIQRADVDLAQLTGTSIRPTGSANDGTYWLDLDNTNWGIYEWDSDGFVLQTPVVINDSALLSSGVPLTSVGAIGDYAVVTTSTSNPIYYKGYDNSWTLVGSDFWKDVVPTITGAIANPGNLSIGNKMVINGVNVSLTGTTVTSAAADINGSAITGVSASVNAVGQLQIYVDSLAASSGNVLIADGKITIAKGTTIGGVDCAIKLGLFDADLDGTGNTATRFGPTISFASYRNNPAWKKTDTSPRPYGSVWFKTSATGNGASWGIKEYSSNLDTWSLQAAPLYTSDTAAINDLDSVGGGAGLAVGTIYVKYDTISTSTATFRPYIKNVTGLVNVTGTTPVSPLAFTAGNTFSMEVSVPGSGSTQTKTITISGSGNAVPATTFVADVLSAGLPNISASVGASGAISISHLAGGTIKFTALTGTPFTTAGLHNDSNVQTLVSGSVWLASPFTPLIYISDTVAPYSNPTDGTYWYYNTPLEVDILINDGAGWKGYLNVVNDARGYDLSATDSNGPILSATEPTEQSGGGQLVAGDLWIDTGDLENYPVIYRYTGSSFELIDNTDQVSVDGILFADARWSYNDSTDPVVDDIPAITDLLSSDYIDSDCPNYQLYARGTLMFNTRRSGYNVKRFESEWFANDTVPPTEVGAWVSSSGNDSDDVPYFGHWAQRNVVVEAMKSAIESSVDLREEQVQFNLICSPGYPELIQNMITLNNDRLQTAFIIGDAPLSLSSDSTTLEQWAKNTNLALDNGKDGLVSNSEYLGVYYPSGFATNLDGESVVVPASHMMLRTFIRSDNVSYPWFAPAGVRRGLIDNATAIGYVDTADDSVFRSIGVTNGLRDVLYENKVNPLTILPGVGLVAYGQKTRASMTSAMDRVNVARLVCYLRNVLAKVAAPFIFEPNDTITRSQVAASFEAVLNDVVAKRGIYDYLVVCDETNNTPDRIDRYELYIDIAIKPVKAIEFVYIPVRLKNTGESLTTI
jgi:hypothetical protein